MVLVTEVAVCIDRYEASEGAGGVAQSVARVMPWVGISWNDVSAACAAVGKRLCEADEWLDLCSGPPPGTVYPYGDTPIDNACNGIAYWEDPGASETLPTGSVATCEGGYSGIFDMSGNVWEWTAPCAGDCFARGGADIDDASGLRCDSYLTLSPSVAGGNVGFRCCRSP